MADSEYDALLARQKARLEAIRARREARRAARLKKDAERQRSAGRRDPDPLSVDSGASVPNGAVAAAGGGRGASVDAKQVTAEAAGTPRGGESDGVAKGGTSSGSGGGGVGGGATATTRADAVLSSVTKIIGARKKDRKVELGFSETSHYMVKPATRVIRYDKGVQIELETKEERALQDQLSLVQDQLREARAAAPAVGETAEAASGGSPAVAANVQSIEEERAAEREAKARLLSLQERKRVMRTSRFASFFRKASTVVERAIAQNASFDVTIDYSRQEEKSDRKEEAMLSPGALFADVRANQRAVTSIAWSPKHKDLFLVSYAEQQNIMSMDPDGLILVWSTNTPTRPEYTLTCQSAVLTARFHPVAPNIVLAGTKSGQVIVWDISAKTTPVNRTSLSQGHTYPVYAIATVPSVNKAHSILSVSTDGHVCVWQDTDHLEEPSLELDLQRAGRKGEGKDRDITTTCFGFVGRDANHLILGSDEGILYQARIYEAPNVEPGVHQRIPAHAAPISNVTFRPPIKGLPTLMSELYLTSSFDWTTKLWHTKTRKPLFTFERCRDYVYDIQWSPAHPAVFATGDGNGLLDIWNLNQDPELPVKSVQAADKDRTISKISFSGDGTMVAVGSSAGNVRMFVLADKLAQPTEDDAKRFYELMQRRLQLAQRQTQQAERERLQTRFKSGSYSGFSSISSIISSGGGGSTARSRTKT